VKKALLLSALVACASMAHALDLNKKGTVSVLFDVAGLFFNEAAVHIEGRVSDMYALDLGLIYGYGGRSAHPNGNFFELDPGLKVIPSGVEDSVSNGYMKVLGKVQFPLLGDTLWGFGGGLGYTRAFGAFVLNPEFTSELFPGQQPSLSFRLNAGGALN
jgi:hypothetical protein